LRLSAQEMPLSIRCVPYRGIRLRSATTCN
jgi:hypothetical protein